MAKFVTAFWFLITLISTISTGLSQTWSYDIIEITSNTSNKDVVDLNLELVRLGRGKFAVNGFMDIKIDVYDDATIQITTERSVDRAGPYTSYPMGVPKQTLTKYMNNYYKKLVQPTAEKCCENAPIIGSKFQPPLTKRYIKFNECVFNTENLPSRAMESYYKFHVQVLGPAEMSMYILVFISNDHF